MSITITVQKLALKQPFKIGVIEVASGTNSSVLEIGQNEELKSLTVDKTVEHNDDPGKDVTIRISIDEHISSEVDIASN